MKYRMYIDEVGNSDLKSSDNPNHRFLSLTGVILKLEYVRTILFPKIENLKSKYFKSHPDEPIIFHRKEMVNFKYPFEALKNDELREEFDCALLKLLDELEYTVVSVCLDKKGHKDTYQAWRYDPYHYCLALLLERYIFYLEQNNLKGDVLAESRGGKEDRRLKDSFVRVWEKGTDYVDPIRFQEVLTSKELKVKSKANNISGLQLADLIAHPSRNEILQENNVLNSGIAPFANKVIKILKEKYYQRDGQVFGKKYL